MYYGPDRRGSSRREEDRNSEITHIGAKIALIALGFFIAKFFTL